MQDLNTNWEEPLKKRRKHLLCRKKHSNTKKTQMKTEVSEDGKEGR